MLGGGLATGACHEVFARGEDGGASAMGFGLMLAQCLMQEADAGGSQTLLWLREDKVQRRAALSGPGLADLGFDPARLVLGVLPDAKTLLRASVDALRCRGAPWAGPARNGGPCAAARPDGEPPHGAGRRSVGRAPAAAAHGGATPAPSAARTRWGGGACAVACGWRRMRPAIPLLAVTLLRQRGGPADFNWTLEWDRDAGHFQAERRFLALVFPFRRRICSGCRRRRALAPRRLTHPVTARLHREAARRLPPACAGRACAGAGAGAGHAPSPMHGRAS